MGGAVGPVGLAAPLRGADRDRIRLSRWPPALAEVAARCVRRHCVRCRLSRPELLRQRALRIALRGRRQAASWAPRRVRIPLAARLPRHARRPACRSPGRARALPARHRDRAPSAQVAGLHRRAGSGDAARLRGGGARDRQRRRRGRLHRPLLLHARGYPDVGWRSGPSLPPLRHRPGYQPHARLRRADLASRRRVCGDHAAGRHGGRQRLRLADGRGDPARRGRFPAAARAGAGRGRPPLQPRTL